jgi:hypothetical protein
MFCHELKVYFVKNNHPVSNDQIIKMMELQLRVPHDMPQLKVNPKNSIKSLIKRIKSHFECKVSESIQDGCYGARPGTSSKGLSVWMHAKHLTDRFVTAEGEEMVNPYHLLMEHGELVPDLDGEQFDKWTECLGVETKADNTYNYSGQNTEDAQHIFDFQFTSAETKDNGLVVSVMFHCGGDPRGNYTNKMIFKFQYIEDFYSVIYPSKQLTSQDGE